MKNHKINYKKYITLVSILAMTMVGAATVSENVNNQYNVKYEVANVEQTITQINPVNSKTGVLISYGEKYDDVDWNSIFNFEDQDGNRIDESLLNIEYMSIDAGFRKNLRPLEELFKDSVQEDNYLSRGGGFATAVASLKSDPTIRYEPYNWRYSTVTIKSKNDSPVINTLNAYVTAYEGKPYEEWANIEFSDYEDDRDGKEMQRLVDYPEEFDKDSMKPGIYTIYYGVTDSQGSYKEAKETLTVVAVQPPSITANVKALKATSEQVDLLKTLDITAKDSLDGDVSNTLEIVETNIDLKKEGTYSLKVRAKNSYGKTAEETIELKVTSDAPTLEAKNVELTQENRTFNAYKDIEFTAKDNVDGDLTDNVVIKDDVNLNKAGRYFVELTVINSNGKQATKQVTVTVNPAEVPETPKVEVPEVEAPEVEAPEVEVPEVEAPETEAPEVETPEVEVPEVEAPEVEAPEVEVPETETPEVEVPEAPEVETPEQETPDAEPEVEAPEVEVPETEKEDETDTTEAPIDPKKVEENVDKQVENVKPNVEKEDETEAVAETSKVTNDLKKEDEKAKKDSPDTLLQTDIPTLSSTVSGLTGLVSIISGLIGFNYFKKRK